MIYFFLPTRILFLIYKTVKAGYIKNRKKNHKGKVANIAQMKMLNLDDLLYSLDLWNEYTLFSKKRASGTFSEKYTCINQDSGSVKYSEPGTK